MWRVRSGLIGRGDADEGLMVTIEGELVEVSGVRGDGGGFC